MTEIDGDLAYELAQVFNNCAKAIGDRLYGDNPPTFGTPTYGMLHDKYLTLLKLASDMVDHAIGRELDDATEDADRITKLTKKARQAIRNVNNLKTVLQIASSVITVGAAVMAGNLPGAAAAALDGLESLLS